METLDILFFDGAAAAYAAAFVLYLVYAFTRREDFSRTGHGALMGAAAAHVLSMAARTAAAYDIPGHSWYVPWSNGFESLSLFALLIALLFLLVQVRNPLPILGVFVLPWTVLCLVIAFNYPRAIPLLHPDLQSVWMAIHVPVMFAAYAAFANAFGIGIAYLVQERQIKSRHPTELSYRLPSLEELDRLIFRIILFAFPALTLGLGLGTLWARGAWGRWWSGDPKEIWSLITWAVYGLYVAVRLGAGWRGRRTAYLSLAGFAVMIFTYVGVNYFSQQHGFLSGGPK